MDEVSIFIGKIAEILEVNPEELSLETDFRNDTPYWDSLKGFGMLVLLEEDYGLKMPVDEFLECKTLADLYDKLPH